MYRIEKNWKIRVLVQDNGSTHTSKLAQQHWTRQKEQELYLFFLPSYCSETNRIELEWLHTKRD
ncbi:MAG: transposase [Cyanobacteriota bacterium]